MTDAGLLKKLEHRHSEIFWRTCRYGGSRMDDMELEILERRITALKKKMVGMPTAEPTIQVSGAGIPRVKTPNR